MINLKKAQKELTKLLVKQLGLDFEFGLGEDRLTAKNSVSIDGVSYPTHYIQDILDRCGPISDFQILERNNTAAELRLVVSPESWEEVSAMVRNYFPNTPLVRIDPEDLVFVGIRGKFSYLLHEASL